MQHRGQRLGEAVGEGLEHQSGVVVLVDLEAGDVFIDADARGAGETADVVRDAGVGRGDEVRQAVFAFAVGLFALFA